MREVEQGWKPRNPSAQSSRWGENYELVADLPRQIEQWVRAVRVVIS